MCIAVRILSKIMGKIFTKKFNNDIHLLWTLGSIVKMPRIFGINPIRPLF